VKAVLEGPASQQQTPEVQTNRFSPATNGTTSACPQWGDFRTPNRFDIVTK
jgi:hypothetical protein